MNFESIIILWAVLISGVIALVLLNIILILIRKHIDAEKLSAYECGFHPFEEPRQNFNVRFYLVSIIFMVFDLEIIFLFPWVISFNFLNWFGYIVVIVFLIILTIGFIYEWLKGALVWE